MLGQLLFGETPIALIGQPPRIEEGWIKQGKNPAVPGWYEQEKNHVDTIEVDDPTTNWNVIK